MIEDGSRRSPAARGSRRARGRLTRLAGAGRDGRAARARPSAALDEMREALTLDRAVLYLPDADGQPVLRRYVGDEAEPELSFDEEAWRLVSGAPIVLREPAGWLVANPFTPPARDWVILPLVSGGRGDRERARADRDRPAQRHGAEPARARSSPPGSRPRSCGASCRRRRWSASGGRWPPRSTTASPSTSPWPAASCRCRSPTRERLREAVESAHRLVRARLQVLSTDTPASLREALDAAARRSRAAVHVSGHGDAGPEIVTLASRVVSEALANADAHAPGARRRDPLRGHRHAAGGDRRRRRPRLRSRDARRASRTAISG